MEHNIPVSLSGVGGPLGWFLFGFVTLITVLGIVLTSIKIDKFQVLEVVFMLLGGIMYTVESILHGIGAKKKYMHSVFHIFCLLGTFFHFWSIYFYLL